MVYRVYTEKKAGLCAEADKLCADIKTFLGIKGLGRVRLLNRYDVENIAPELFENAVATVFSEPPVDNVYYEMPEGGTAVLNAADPDQDFDLAKAMDNIAMLPVDNVYLRDERGQIQSTTHPRKFVVRFMVDADDPANPGMVDSS